MLEKDVKRMQAGYSLVIDFSRVRENSKISRNVSAKITNINSSLGEFHLTRE